MSLFANRTTTAASDRFVALVRNRTRRRSAMEVLRAACGIVSLVPGPIASPASLAARRATLGTKPHDSNHGMAMRYSAQATVPAMTIAVTIALRRLSTNLSTAKEAKTTLGNADSDSIFHARCPLPLSLAHTILAPPADGRLTTGSSLTLSVPVQQRMLDVGCSLSSG